MSYTDNILNKKRELKVRYRELLEDAYNLSEVDEAMSDIAAFKATLVLNKINKLKFVVTDSAVMA